MEFVCPDPLATVRAANARATLDAFKLLPSAGRQLMEKHQLHLDDLTADKVVPVQRWLNALQELHLSVGPLVLRRVGAAIVENAQFPAEFDTVEAVLLALDQIYHLNHHGNVGHYVVQQQPQGEITVRCETPYPRHFEWGLVEGICRNRTAGTARYEVHFEEGPPQSQVTCTLTVRRKAV